MPLCAARVAPLEAQKLRLALFNPPVKAVGRRFLRIVLVVEESCRWAVDGESDS